MIDHPLAHDALMELRDVRTAPPEFRRAAARISLLLVAEALRSVHTVVTTVTTPLGPAEGRVVRTDIVVVPVLRAGLSMMDAVLQLVPSARVGHIGLQRDETTAVASRYYSKLPPDIGDSHVLMVDPDAGDRRQFGGRDRSGQGSGSSQHRARLRHLCAGRNRGSCRRAHPDVDIYTPVVDRELNAHKFIVPGLGDFGDRLYGRSAGSDSGFGIRDSDSVRSIFMVRRGGPS